MIQPMNCCMGEEERGRNMRTWSSCDPGTVGRWTDPYPLRQGVRLRQPGGVGWRGGGFEGRAGAHGCKRRRDSRAKNGKGMEGKERKEEGRRGEGRGMEGRGEERRAGKGGEGEGREGEGREGEGRRGKGRKGGGGRGNGWLLDNVAVEKVVPMHSKHELGPSVDICALEG